MKSCWQMVLYKEYDTMNPQMKNVIIPFLLIGVLFSASFGLVMMGHSDGQGHSQCPFEKAKVIECMKFENVLGSVIAHLGAVSQFFSTIPVSAFLASLILALFFTAFLGFREGNCFRPGLIYFLGRDGKPLIVSAQTLFSEWLSLHENSPSFSIKR